MTNFISTASLCKLDKVKNQCIAHNFSPLSSLCKQIILGNGNLTKIRHKQYCAFLGHGVFFTFCVCISEQVVRVTSTDARWVCVYLCLPGVMVTRIVQMAATSYLDATPVRVFVLFNIYRAQCLICQCTHVIARLRHRYNV